MSDLTRMPMTTDPLLGESLVETRPAATVVAPVSCHGRRAAGADVGSRVAQELSQGAGHHSRSAGGRPFGPRW